MTLGNMDNLVPGHKGMQVRRMNPKRMARLLQLLSDPDEPRTISQLAELTGCSRTSTWQYINAMKQCRSPRLIHVAEWVSGRSGIRPLWVAAYTFGDKPDAKRPPKVPAYQRCIEYRLRKRRRELDAKLSLRAEGE